MNDAELEFLTITATAVVIKDRRKKNRRKKKNVGQGVAAEKRRTYWKSWGYTQVTGLNSYEWMRKHLWLLFLVGPLFEEQNAHAEGIYSELKTNG